MGAAVEMTDDPSRATVGGGRADASRFRWVALFVLALMLYCSANILLHDGFGHGAGLDTFNAGAANPWQFLINMDLMSGLALMVAWIIWRDWGGSVLQTVAWVLIVLWWGNIMVAIYALRLLATSGGDATTFFLGRRAGGPEAPKGKPLGSPLQIAALIGAVASVAVMVHGLAAVGFAGVPAIGYVGAFGTLGFGLAVFAFSRPARG